MILSLNTATNRWGLALIDDNRRVQAEIFLSSKKGNFRFLMPYLSELLDRMGIDLDDIKCISVAIGPGNFTGLRVGLAAAKGISFCLGIPVLGVNTLDAIAFQSTLYEGMVLAILEARRDDIFISMYKIVDYNISFQLMPVRCIHLLELREILKRDMWVIGNSYERYHEYLSSLSHLGFRLIPSRLWGLRASSVGLCGIKRYKTKEFGNIKDMVPFYINPPDIRKNPYPLIEDSQRLTNE